MLTLSTTYIFYALLVIGALARFREEVDWSHSSAWALAAMVALILVTGIVGEGGGGAVPQQVAEIPPAPNRTNF